MLKVLIARLHSILIVKTANVLFVFRQKNTNRIREKKFKNEIVDGRYDYLKQKNKDKYEKTME